MVLSKRLLSAAMLWASMVGVSSASELHPNFALLDAQGEPVSQSLQPLSTEITCGQCHDAGFISRHSDHAQAHQVLMTRGQSSQGEMNCLLCHQADADVAAYARELNADDSRWASSAILTQTELGAFTGEQWQWDNLAFDAEGQPHVPLQLGKPTDAACGSCHDQVHSDLQQPLTLSNRDSQLTGEIFSAQRLSDSGLNLADKAQRNRSFDVHAERVVGCVDCHYAANNPAHTQPTPRQQPDHLVYDPRRLTLGDYLKQPLHQFGSDGQMRDCQACHDAEPGHAWLPFAKQHFSAVACESCHVPELFGAPLQAVDGTLLDASGDPLVRYRGVDGAREDPTGVNQGYRPVLLPQAGAEGSEQLAPHNLVGRWYWQDAATGQAVAAQTLQRALFVGEGYHPQILAALDSDNDGHLNAAELRLVEPAHVAVVADRLQQLGVVRPQVVADLQAHPIHHGVTTGRFAVRECSECHAEASLLTATVALIDNPPAGVIPTVEAESPLRAGLLELTDSGLSFRAAPDLAGYYILGRHSLWWVDWLGIAMALATALGVAGHGLMRYIASRSRPHKPVRTKRVYMYSVYQRLWHWTQAGAILVLLVTGFIIHKPDLFAIFNYPFMIHVHNVLGFLLVINAALALFYHLASGEIRQFLPGPQDFFGQAFIQAKYYMTGIFRGDPHPFEKTKGRKLNPLQRIAYFGLLNLLLPAQVITGLLIWSLQQWPEIAELTGGLAILAPLHALLAWTFGSFLIMHIYLTTTAGPKPTSGIHSMVVGWEDLEQHETHTTGARRPARENKELIHEQA